MRGGTGSGKTRVAAAVAQAQEAVGRVVTVVSPTEAGRRALQAEGVAAMTLGAFFSEPTLCAAPGDPERVVILDDAHGLGIGRADVLLARIEMMDAKLVAMVNPDRRPAGAGPVFAVMANRMSASNRMEPAGLTGLHGVDSADLLALAQGLRSGDSAACRDALKQVWQDGLVQAADSKEEAIAAVARAYVADRSADKLAVGWGRADAEALTEAIRARLDEVDPERRGFRAAEHGPLKELKPGDCIRFTSSGVFGAPAHGDVTPPPGSVGPQTERIQRGDVAEVLGSGSHNTLRIRVTSGQGDQATAREVTVPPEGPLPRWLFAFASTIMAAAGSRHENVHLLGGAGMDREILSAGSLVARDRLNLVMPVAEDRLDEVLGKIAGRVRPPRSGLDHGFDPARAGLAAKEAHQPGLPLAQVPVSGMNPDEPEMDQGEIARLTEVPKVSLSATQLRAANVAFLKDTPDQILALVQVDRPVFTESDVRRGLRDRLGSAMGEAELQALGDRVMRSDELLRLGRPAPDGAPQYVTVARAGVMGQCAEDASRLAKGVFDAGKAPIVKPDGPDGLNPTQRAAAEAMLAPERLVLVQGHAGTGKTHTLGRVAQTWRDRGVTVLAGASSGRATDELAVRLKGVPTRTLAGWEAAWARGEVPPQGRFVFIMDEAGMVGVGQWSRLQRQVAALGGKLIAVGDPDQLQPVSDLPGWAIAERAAGHSVVMDTVLRQKELMDREATEALARGGEGVAAALRYYAQKDAVKLDPEVRGDPVGAIARAYWNGSGSRIAVAGTNRDVAQLNDAIRLEGLAKGKIGPNAGTDPNAGIDGGSVRRYGTITREFAGAGGRRERVAVPLDLGVGERIILTGPHGDPGLSRSSLGAVVATRDRDIDVLFDGATDAVTLDLETFRGLDYGYAVTGHKAQGMGADRVHVLPHRIMNRHALYVALSRHKDSVTVYGRAGHADCLADLIRMGQAAGHLDLTPDDVDALAAVPAAAMVPGADIVGLGSRADWQAMTEGVSAGTGFAGDAELMAVAEHHAGLLAARYHAGDPVLNPDVEDARGLCALPAPGGG